MKGKERKGKGREGKGREGKETPLTSRESNSLDYPFEKRRVFRPPVERKGKKNCGAANS